MHTYIYISPAIFLVRARTLACTCLLNPRPLLYLPGYRSLESITFTVPISAPGKLYTVMT